jgi:ABC-type multidrug transport system permease subunit
LKSVLAGIAGVIGLAALFGAGVMIASRIKFGFLSPMFYDPLAIAQSYWFVALPMFGIAFAVGFVWHRRTARPSKMESGLTNQDEI